MFKRFFSALANLTGNIEASAASFAEANARFRHNVLDGPGELPVLDHHAGSEEPATNGKPRKKAAAK